MSDLAPPAIDLVRPLLADDETIWAVYPGSRSIVATERRLFFVADGQVYVRPLSDFADVRRVRDTLIVFAADGDAPSVAIEVVPDDEDALQALTVVGLLVASGGKLARREGRRTVS